MRVDDLHILPKFSDGWSYLYLERCRVDQDAKAIAAVTGLSANLIRATIEASKSAVPTAGLRGAPSAPSELRATAMEAPAST